jgi:hypothetical protein
VRLAAGGRAASKRGASAESRRHGNADFKPSAFKEKRSDLDASRLMVVAFVQEATSHRVLQVAVAQVAAAKP